VNPRRRRLEIALGGVVVLLGLLQAWATRDSIQNDVVSYLDMGDALLRGDWATGINGMWNPLYGVVLALALRVTGPGPEREYAVVHGFAFVTFLAALAAFRFLLRELLIQPGPSSPAPGKGAVSAESWIILGYAIFAWSALDLVGVWTTNPDMLVAACVFGATGLLLRIRRGPTRYRDFLALGLVLGFAYLVKSFMLLGSVAFFTVAALAARRGQAPIRKVAVATLGFLILGGPFIAALSSQRGRMTFSETGRVNYAWYVNGVPHMHWQGGPAEAGAPVHPTRRIALSPPTFEFDRSLPVTYALWYDPSYWYEGVRIRLHPVSQLRVLGRNLAFLIAYMAGASGVFVFGLLLLGLLKPDWVAVGAWWRRNVGFLAPSAVGIGLYALVHVEPRYLGAFLAILLLGAFLSLASAGSERTAGLMRAISIACGVLLVAPLLGRAESPRYYAYLFDPFKAPQDPEQIPGESSSAAPWRIAVLLRRHGIAPGDRIGVVQSANRIDAAWARLAGVRIVAEVRPARPDESFWRASKDDQRRVVEAMSRLGVRAIVSDTLPPEASDPAWTPLGQTGYFLLAPADVAASASETRPAALAP
jgi:hypothetical protein